MPKVSTRIDMTGQQFGKWTVLSFVGRFKQRSVWLCQCSCGRTQQIMRNALTRGKSRQCFNCSTRTKIHGHAGSGGSQTMSPTYKTWLAMRRRCTVSTDVSYHRYGKQGVTVDPRWLQSFQEFLADMGERPEGMTLDRKDNSKGYSRENCRWATRSEQGRNRHTTVWLTYLGETRCLSDWADHVGMNRKTLASRLKAGWPLEKALTNPKGEGRT